MKKSEIYLDYEPQSAFSIDRSKVLEFLKGLGFWYEH